MNNIEKLLINLESTNANNRYEACEELRVAKAISKQAIDALEKATNDPDPLVADAAQRALLIHKPPTPASQEIQELDRSIGGIKVVDEQKAPTIWHVLGIGVLIAGIYFLIIYSSPVGYFFKYAGWFLLWYLPTTAILGAGLGVWLFKKKNYGIWIGAVLGPLLAFIIIFFLGLI